MNYDGREDVLFYTTGGEETYLDILVKVANGYAAVDLPLAEDYEIIESQGSYELRLGHGTYTRYGNVYGSDKYLWYDFYQLIGHSLESRNKNHPETYKRMASLYSGRLQELEDRILRLRQKELHPEADESWQKVFR